MTKRKRTDLIFLTASVISFLLMSVSFLLMPFGKAENGNVSVLTYVSGGMFWLFLLLGTFFIVLLSKRRKKWHIYNRVKRYSRALKMKKGIFSFFKNKFGTVADALLILSLIGLTVSIIVSDSSAYICYVFVSIFVFAFCTHCIFNGKTFYYVINQDMMLKAAEKEPNENIREDV